MYDIINFMISLDYVPVKFKLNFMNNIDTRKEPPFAFVLRSVLGYNLRSMCCIAHGSECASCQYNQTCAYAFIFETILPLSNKIKPGTNRASHPFIFSNSKPEQSEFTITLLGRAIDYLPYIYAAFVRAGKYGLFKSRTQYSIEDLLISEKSILIDEQNIDMNFDRFEWSISGIKTNPAEILVELKTPLRFKTKGKYISDFTADDFMMCLYRRMKTVCMLYGNFDDATDYIPQQDKIKIVERNLHWQDYTHYSSRQKSAMELGGVTGTFKLIGQFSDFEIAMLDFAKLFNAGKNTNFGLGQLDYWMK